MISYMNISNSFLLSHIRLHKINKQNNLYKRHKLSKINNVNDNLFNLSDILYKEEDWLCGEVPWTFNEIINNDQINNNNRTNIKSLK